MPRILVPAYLPTPEAAAILRACLRSVQFVTAAAYELWVIDNNSPEAQRSWLRAWPGIGLVLSNTTPIPPKLRRPAAAWWARLRGKYHQRAWGSYANAVGLELGRRFISPAATLLVTLHMDTLAIHPDWLTRLSAKIHGTTAVAGTRCEKNRVPAGVIHVLGCMVDYQLFQKLQLDYFPDLPAFDVGDLVTVRLRGAGYEAASLANSHTDPSVLDHLPADHPVRRLGAETALDEDGVPVFLHLGRGLRVSTEGYDRGPGLREWLRFADSELPSLAGNWMVRNQQ